MNFKTENKNIFCCSTGARALNLRMWVLSWISSIHCIYHKDALVLSTNLFTSQSTYLSICLPISLPTYLSHRFSLLLTNPSFFKQLKLKKNIVFLPYFKIFHFSSPPPSHAGLSVLFHSVPDRLCFLGNMFLLIFFFVSAVCSPL